MEKIDSVRIEFTSKRKETSCATRKICLDVFTSSEGKKFTSCLEYHPVREFINYFNTYVIFSPISTSHSRIFFAFISSYSSISGACISHLTVILFPSMFIINPVSSLPFLSSIFSS